MHHYMVTALINGHACTVQMLAAASSINGTAAMLKGVTELDMNATDIQVSALNPEGPGLHPCGAWHADAACHAHHLQK